MFLVLKYSLTASGSPPTSRYFLNKSIILLWVASSKELRFSNFDCKESIANRLTPFAIKNSSKSRGYICFTVMLPIGIDVVFFRVIPNNEPLAMYVNLLS